MLDFDELDELEPEKEEEEASTDWWTSARASAGARAQEPEERALEFEERRQQPSLAEERRVAGGQAAAAPVPSSASTYEGTQELQSQTRGKVLSLQQARQVQTLILREFMAEEFQARLARAQFEAGEDLEKRAAACELLAVGVQVKIAAQHGYQASAVGVAQMQTLFILYATDAEIVHRSALLRWLVDPVAQLTTPIPVGPARCFLQAVARVSDASGRIVCETGVHLQGTVRAIKEQVSLQSQRSDQKWYTQRLFFDGKELFDQAVLSSIVRLHSVADFDLKFRRPEVVEWLEKLKQGARMIKEVPAELMADREFLLPAVQVQASVLETASEEQRTDADFLAELLPHCGQALQYVPSEFRADRALVLAAVKQDAWALEFAAPELKADREVVLAAVQSDGEALQFAAPNLWADPEVVLAATHKDPSAILAVPELRSNRRIVMKAVLQDWRLLQQVPQEMRADREVVLSAVRQSGRALQHADPSRQADREVVLMAVKNSGDSLRFAAPALLRDREVVLAAVRNSPMTLGMIPKEIVDLQIACTAVKQDRRALQYVDSSLRLALCKDLGIDEVTEGNPWLESKIGNVHGTVEPEASVEDMNEEPGGLAQHFAVLNLSETASREEVKKRYHRLALQYHPDKFTGDPEVAKDLFQRLQTAFEAISMALEI